MRAALSPHAFADLSLFSGLPETLSALAPALALGEADAGAVMIGQGKPVARLHILMQGAVELIAAERDGEATLRIVSPFEPFPLAAVIADAPCLMSARTLERSRLLTIDAAALRREAGRSTDFSRRINRLLAAEVRMGVRQLSELKLRDGARRVGGYLLRLADRGAASALDLPAPKGRIASRLGITPETLSRALGLLRRHGLTVRGRRVVLRDRAKLERFCRPDPLIDASEHRPA